MVGLVFRSTAHVYDLVYEAQGKDYAAEAAELRRLVDERTPGARTLLDVACATGAHLEHLSKWFDVVGVDLDAEMLAQARRRLPGVRLEVADMRELDLDERFDAVTCLFNAVGYLRGTEELDAAVAAMARHLAPGGVLIVDGWVRPEEWISDALPHVEVATRDDVTVVRLSRSSRAGNTTHLEMHHLVATREGVDHLVDEHDLTLFTTEEYERAFVAAGLEVSVVQGPMPGRDRFVAQ